LFLVSSTEISLICIYLYDRAMLSIKMYLTQKFHE
jgi:hypothetical protein